MAGLTTHVAPRHPFQVRSMADRIGAGGDTVGQSIGPMRALVAVGDVFPYGDAGGVYLHRSAQMATGAGGTAAGDAGQGLAVAVAVGAGGNSACRDVGRMMGIGVIAPGERMHVLLVSHVALGAGNLGGAPA